jgi:hypothetical protein
MKRHTILQILLMMLIASVSVTALGGGGSKSPPEDDTVRVTMKPVNEDDSDIYGWCRISPDKFSVGANRLEPKTYYAVYLENSETRKAMTDKPARRSFGDGEFKFETRLKEPFGGEWDKVVIYRRPNGKEDSNGEVAVLEGVLE